MNDVTAAPHPIRFLAWTLALSIPFYVWSVLWPVRGLPFGLPVSVVMIVIPATVATILAAHEAGPRRVRDLWLRLADVKRSAGARWIALSLLCMPLASLAAYGAMRAFGRPLPEAINSPVWQAPVLITVFFCGAMFEEVGWTGYATQPLQRRYGVNGAGLIIGTVWALWHVPAWWLGQGHTTSWVVGQCAATIAMRLIMGHIYDAGGRSLFLAVLFHAMINTCWVLFPNGGSHYDPLVVAPILAAIAAALASAGRRPEQNC
jgi:membrane protease YdiL (CAAX protease family)